MPAAFLLALLVTTEIAASAQRIDVKAQASTSVRYPRQGVLVGAGIEDVNHELYGGLYSQMIFGESFEEPPGNDGVSNAWADWSGKCFCNVTPDAANGVQSQIVANGSIVSFGLRSQGLSLLANLEYNGYIYLKLLGSATVSLKLIMAHGHMCKNATCSETLASLKVAPREQGSWSRIDFAMTPSKSTKCEMTNNARQKCFDTPELGQSCYQCTGGFVLEASGAPVLFDMVFLQPGRWGRYKDLPVRKDVAEVAFEVAGWQLIRLGGSMVNSAGYRWKTFRGPRDRRQPYNGYWYKYASSGFRMFEVLDLCEKAQVACAITINSQEQAPDMADFVEYCFGNVTTFWGNQRALDGHPHSYPPFTIEIGNEQELDDIFVQQVYTIGKAMLERASSLNLPFPLRIAIGQNFDSDANGRNRLATTLAMLQAIREFGGNAAWDAHIGGDSFEDSQYYLHNILHYGEVLFGHFGGRNTKMVVFEENGFTHNMQRALVHARMNIVSSYAGGFLLLDAAANGLQILGQNSNGWDQGQVFLTPDKAWLSPFGWAQHMLSKHSSFNTPVKVTNTSKHGLDLGAYVAQDGSVGLRAVNWSPNVISCDIALDWEFTLKPTLEVIELVGQSLASVNPPYDRHRVAPHVAGRGTIHAASTGTGTIVQFEFKPFSFVIMALRSKMGNSNSNSTPANLYI